MPYNKKIKKIDLKKLIVEVFGTPTPPPILQFTYGEQCYRLDTFI